MRRFLPLVAALFLLLAGSASAQSAAQQITLSVARDYQADGVIDPCAFTTEQLQTALSQVGLDTKQYGADLIDAIRAAIAARARGDCDEEQAPAATPTPTPSPTPSPTPTATAIPMTTIIEDPPTPDANIAFKPPSATTSLDASKVGGPGNDIPTPLLLLLILGALAGLATTAARYARRHGFAQSPLGHTWREAAWRFSGNWEAFRDWVRLGR